MATSTPSKDRNLLAVIGDEVCHHLDSLFFFVDISASQDTITGLLLAGIGQVTQDQRKNFFIVEPSTQSL
jgi:V-type H+-transporting ATPase subunit F